MKKLFLIFCIFSFINLNAQKKNECLSKNYITGVYGFTTNKYTGKYFYFEHFLKKPFCENPNTLNSQKKFNRLLIMRIKNDFFKYIKLNHLKDEQLLHKNYIKLVAKNCKKECLGTKIKLITKETNLEILKNRYGKDLMNLKDYSPQSVINNKKNRL